jgi:hypothetical protein
MALWLRTVLKLTPIVAFATLAAILGLIAFREVAPLDALTGSSGEVGNYLQTVGGIYAVLLAFVVFVVWSQFNDARGFIEREASALVDLHRTASGLPNGSRIAIQNLLRDYVTAVLTDEWRAMARHDAATLDRVGQKLEHVWLEIHRCRPETVPETSMYTEVLSRFNDVSDLRTSRLTSAGFRIPLTMKILLYAGAFILTGSMYLMYIPALWLHAVVTGALAGAIAHILYLVIDLDNAFAGTMQVSMAPYERALAAFDRCTHLVPNDECR